MAATADFKVFLELQRRNELNAGRARAVNRIPLFVTEVDISTAKTVPTVPVPFIAMAKGFSETLAFDMGIATKTVSLTGVLLNQTISKDSLENDSSAKEVVMTPFELAQLIHSYVDSSQAQDDQFINKLIILIPSRVDTNLNYHTASSEDDDMSVLPLIPFTFQNRRYDERFKRVINDKAESEIGVENLVRETPVEFFTDVSNIDELPGMLGFIRSFNTGLSGEQPNTVNFTLEFEIATVLAENPINNL
tara:strand:- start:355 stop:1101 length:747 start_codon:yes stop_codon:yes gene_type:complete